MDKMDKFDSDLILTPYNEGHLDFR
jgi:hypothetical protein